MPQHSHCDTQTSSAEHSSPSPHAIGARGGGDVSLVVGDSVAVEDPAHAATKATARRTMRMRVS